MNSNKNCLQVYLGFVYKEKTGTFYLTFKHGTKIINTHLFGIDYDNYNKYYYKIMRYFKLNIELLRKYVSEKDIKQFIIFEKLRFDKNISEFIKTDSVHIVYKSFIKDYLDELNLIELKEDYND